MMSMMNRFCEINDRRKVLSLISIQNHCQSFWPLQTSDMSEKEFEDAQNWIQALLN